LSYGTENCYEREGGEETTRERERERERGIHEIHISIESKKE